MKRFKVHILMKGTISKEILFEWYYGTNFDILKSFMIVNGRSLKEEWERPIGAKEEMKAVEFNVWGLIKEGYETIIEEYLYHTMYYLREEGLEVISKTSGYYSIEGYKRPHNYVELLAEGD